METFMQKLITGILAHVDAGKTTLSEALLFNCGKIRNLGRVDTKNSFLDNNSIERERGITIFSKQAVLNEKITLIDTPGHIDFSAEMERTLSVLDAAILLVNASDGIQSHTKTLWRLLEKHNIPTLVFVNKIDIADSNKTKILSELQKTFSTSIIDFSTSERKSENFYEKIAESDEILLEKYLNGEKITDTEIKKAIYSRKIFPCIFGSALKMQGIDELLEILSDFFASRPAQSTTEEFGCIVYKISKDEQNNRLSHLKITGGKLCVKDFLGEEKVNEIRIYSGKKFEQVKEIGAGEICSVTGLKTTKAGSVFGKCDIKFSNEIESALIYSVFPPKEIDIPKMFAILKEIEDEFPELKVDYNEETGEINVMLMGEIQTEVLKEILQERYKINVEFGEGKIAYKETIEESVVGVGHYEPLKHYAEVHLQMTPLERGSGLRFISELSVDELDTNWQRLILTHLKEKKHIGILTGSAITDMEIKVIAGKAHLKHTEGGDFRQSTYRAIRQGLMKSKSILLEPIYSFEITVPESNVGRVMSDIERMCGNCTIAENQNGFTILNGKCPVSTMKNYATELRSFSKGQGTISFSLSGYEKCHNEKEIIEKINYNPLSDLRNPASSVFCSHGAGFVVEWDKVDNFKHIH